MFSRPDRWTRQLFALCACASLLASREGLCQAPPAPTVPAQIVSAFDNLFGGMHPGLRAVHAKGVVATGEFVPSPEAPTLSRAVHFKDGPTPVIVRFSNFAGIPDLADAAPEANPRGMAIRFLLPGGLDTDIVAHSYDGFPAATPEEFLAFLRALPDPAALARFADTHAAAKRFLADPKSTPASYGTQAYFGVNAFRFTNAAGVSRYGRYRILPVAGTRYLAPVDLAIQPPGFLGSEFRHRLRAGPIEFRLMAQLALADDVVTDGTVLWPTDRPTIELGRIVLRALASSQDSLQQELSFTPTNLVGGIEPSDDPMLLARTQAYRVSADRRGASD